MISFIWPWMFGAIGLGSIAVGIVHLLSVHKPPELSLPTARFLPERHVRAVSRTKRPSDILLLLLRVLVLFLAGIAAAGPLWQTTGSNTVVLAVIGDGVTVDTASDTATIRQATRAGRVMTARVNDREENATHGDGAVWPVAWRAASNLLPTLSPTDSLELHVFIRTGDALHAPGWNAWRSTWPGTVVTHTMPLSDDVNFPARDIVIVNGDSATGVSTTDDVVRAALQWHAARLNGVSTAAANIDARVRTGNNGAHIFTDTVVVYRNNGYERAVPAITDVNTAQTVSKSIRLYWPRDGIPLGFTAVSVNDSGMPAATALVAAGQALVAPFAVHALPRKERAQQYRNLVWFGDGRVAAQGQRTSQECIRSVAVTVTSTSDLLFSPSANGIFDRLLAPCVAMSPVALSQLTLIDTQTVVSPRSANGEGVATNHAFPVVRDFARQSGIPLKRPSRSFLLPMLLASALLLLMVEGRLRTRTGDVS